MCEKIYRKQKLAQFIHHCKRINKLLTFRRCDFHHHLDDFDFLRYQIDSVKFFPVVRKYLESRNVSDRALDYIGTKMTSIRTSHSTALTSVRPYLERRLRSSSYLMNLILKTYYYDFKLFGFELPTVPDN
jgi:hypothetical protein